MNEKMTLEEVEAAYNAQPKHMRHAMAILHFPSLLEIAREQARELERLRAFDKPTHKSCDRCNKKASCAKRKRVEANRGFCCDFHLSRRALESDFRSVWIEVQIYQKQRREEGLA